MKADATPLSSRPSFWSRMFPSRTAHVADNAPLSTTVERLASNCSALEQQLGRQESRLDEIVAIVRSLATELAPIPTAAAQQHQQLEQLQQAIAVHRGETAEAAGMVSQASSVVARTNDAIAAQSGVIAEYGDALNRLVEQAGAARETQSQISSAISRIAGTHEQVAQRVESMDGAVTHVTTAAQEQIAAVQAALAERRQADEKLDRSMRDHSRRMTTMLGVAIGVAAASAIFSIMLLLLRLRGG